MVNEGKKFPHQIIAAERNTNFLKRYLKKKEKNEEHNTNCSSKD